MADAPLLPLDSQLCFSVYSTAIAINRVYKPMLDVGVTSHAISVLSTLWKKNGLTITGIADRLASAKYDYASRKRLEAANFVIRRRSTAMNAVEVRVTARAATCT